MTAWSHRPRPLPPGRGRKGGLTRPRHVSLLLVLVLLSGCVGYLPANVKPKDLSDQVTLIPTYRETKLYAYAVAEGYDERATANRHAIHGGAVVTALSVAGLAATALYGGPAWMLTAIPLAGGTLASVGAVYQNDQKADLYRRASGYVRALITESDLQAATYGWQDALAAVCLKRAVDETQRRVDWHLTLLEPQNVVTLLRTLPTGPQLDKLIAAARGDFSDLDVPPSGPPLWCLRPSR